MKLKSFIAKASVVTILAAAVFFPARYLYNDNENSEFKVVSLYNKDPVIREYSDNMKAYGWQLAGDSCYKNDMASIYPDYDTEAKCEQAGKDYDAQMFPLIKQGLIYGRTQLISGAVMFLAIASILCSLAFVGLRKLWKVT